MREFRHRLSGSSLLLAALLAAPAVAQISTTDTRMLSQPAVGGDRIAFAYAGDLWSARTDGSDVRRLTSALGDEASPVFSPDGRWIAFAGNYDGNIDVYVIPAGGGEPRRLTWHPGMDTPQAFTPDGGKVLFTSSRADFSNRYSQLWTVPAAGGVEERLPIPNAAQATYSPDGRYIAYNPIGRAFEQWKGYRGGRVSQLWLIDTRTWDIEKIPQPAGRSNDVDPMWLEGAGIWFRSDRDGEFNLYRYDRKSKQVTPVTGHKDFPVMAASGQSMRIVYEQAGHLHLLDCGSGKAQRLTIGVAADLAETRPRWVRGAEFVRNVSLSPSGARAVFEIRGEIVTVPAEKGDPRNLTGSPGAHDRSPAWSPDARTIAFMSDQGGEYRLHLAPQDGKGEHRVIELAGAGYYSGLDWSPDGKQIAYNDNSQSIYVLDVATGKSRKVGNFMKDVLEELDRVDLTSVPNAEVAVELIRERRPNVVIMDINLPGMSGYEATRLLRTWEETRDIPVIALTAAAMAGDRKRFEDAGFYRYLTKPVRVAELLETLEGLLLGREPD
jgi:tricorn protease